MSLDQKVLKIYPWSISATGQWGPKTGIYRLRDESPEELARDLWEYGIFIQKTAVFELMAHGNPRKAAQFVRALVNQHPELKDTIRSQYRRMETYLFDTPLCTMPSSPREYPENVQIEFIQ